MSVEIHVRDVSKKLGNTHALDQLSAHFSAGTLHGLIGPDGAGKTTLLRMIMGLLHPDSGQLSYENKGKGPMPFSDLRSAVGYMPQQQSLYADLSISEHLDFFRDLYQIPQTVYLTRRQELLHMTRLDRFQDRPAGQLSGGMYKKLGLMCALLQFPRVLLLDEPTNGVDPISRREFWELLYALKNQKILMIIATAYMDEAERCDTVHILNHGRLLVEGEPRNILSQAQVNTFEELFLKNDEAPSAGGRGAS